MLRFFFVLAFLFVDYAISAPHRTNYVYIGKDDGSYTDTSAQAGIGFFSSMRGGSTDQPIREKHDAVNANIGSQQEAQAQKTVIERTIIPQYAEKTIRVPAYVEKTIKVPTFVDKTIQVPIEPKIIEKKISEEQVPVANVKLAKSLRSDVHYGPSAGHGSGYASGGGVFVSGHGHTHGGGFFDHIFNIPIQTLGAVNGLLNNLSGGGGGASAHVAASYSKGF